MKSTRMEGQLPDDQERLMIFVMEGSRRERHFFRPGRYRIKAAVLVRREFMMRLCTLSVVTGLNAVKARGQAGGDGR